MKKNRMGIAVIAGALMLMGLLFTATPASAQPRVSIGIGVGPAYYPPPPVVYRPPYPGPGYFWTNGYYNPYGVWVGGFWAPRGYVRPFRSGYAPGFYRGGYVGGFRRDFGRAGFRVGRGNAFGYRR